MVVGLGEHEEVEKVVDRIKTRGKVDEGEHGEKKRREGNKEMEGREAHQGEEKIEKVVGKEEDVGIHKEREEDNRK